MYPTRYKYSVLAARRKKLRAVLTAYNCLFETNLSEQGIVKSVYKTKKKSILPLLSGASIILSFAGIGYMQNQLALAQPSGPLSPNEPAAKLDPSLLHVPPMPMPEESISPNASQNESSVEEEGYDVRTGSIQIGTLETDTLETQILSPSITSTTTSSPANLGADANIKPESSNVGVSPLPGEEPSETVQGADNRQLITNTTAYPWRTITKLYQTFPNGERYVCSGVLIAAKYVLTAAHCVHDASRGGWASSVEVIPGLSGTYKPYGSAFATYYRSYTGWTNSRDANYDFALITLDRNIGDSTGWLGYSYYPSVNGITGHLAGYPADKDGGVGLYYHYGSITSSTAQRLYYQIDTAGGQSGSGIYRIDNNQRYVFAVHKGGNSTTNYGTRIDSQKFNDLQRWIATGN